MDNEKNFQFKVGDTFHVLRGAPRIPYKIHILAIIQDMVVFRWYGKHKQWWHYEIEDQYFLESQIEHCEEMKTKRKENKNECR